MSEEVKSVKCPNCGGNVVQNDDNCELCYCPFCGSMIKFDTRSSEQKAYEVYKGKYKAQAEYNEAERKAQREFENEQYKRQNRRALQKSVRRGTTKTLGCLIPILIVVGVIALVALKGPAFIEKLDSYLINPSSYVDVSFKGINGSGTIVYSYHDDAPFVESDIRVTAYPDHDLSNGDSVRVEFRPVNSDSRIKDVTKNYMVSGLQGVEQNLDNVTSTMMDKINETSKSVLKNASGIGTAEYTSLKRYGLYMRYNPEEDTNYLWDVYTIHVSTSYNNHDYGEYTVVVEYPNVTIKSNGELVYDKAKQVGRSKIFGSKFIYGYADTSTFISEVRNNKIENPIYSEHLF